MRFSTQDGDRQPEVLQVLHIFHAAAELPWDRLESLEVETGQRLGCPFPI